MNEPQMNELKWMNWKSKHHNAFWEIILRWIMAGYEMFNVTKVQKST